VPAGFVAVQWYWSLSVISVFLISKEPFRCKYVFMSWLSIFRNCLR
jgi:hypothetical protein